MYRYKIVLLLIVFSSHQLACMATGHAFSKISVQDGLSNNHVNAIYKDSSGFIWIGTLDGIDRYDGVEIKPYSYRFSGSVETVSCITEDYTKTLWVGTTTGLFRYQKETDIFERVDIDSKNISVNALEMLPDSNLCIATPNGIYLVNTYTLQTEKLPLSNLSGDQSISFTDILPDNNGNAWFTSSKGLIKYSLGNKVGEFFQSDIIPSAAYNSFTSICRIGDTLYLGTTSVGIVEFDIIAKEFSRGVDTDNKIILNIDSDNKDLIFVGTDGGGLKVINVSTRDVKNFVREENDPESLSSNSVYSFLLDDEGRYWIGTYSAGISFTKNIKGYFNLHSLTTDFPEVNNSIRSFYFSPDGRQYFGTRNGFAQLSNGRIKIFHSTPGDDVGLRSNIILSVYPFMGDILIGTYGGGISRFSVRDQKILSFLDDPGLSLDNIYAFEMDNFGDLWFTSFNGLYRYSVNNKKLQNFNTENSGLETDQLFEITFDSKNRLWVGSMSGTYAYNYDGDSLRKIDLSILSNNTYKNNFIYEDRTGNIWICTERGGLTMVDSTLSTSITYKDEDGCSDNSVCAIIEDMTGKYWISTLKGFCDYSTETGKFTNYTTSDGLPGLVFTPSAAYEDSEGRLFFGNEEGLVYFNPKDIGLTSISSKIVITDFYLSGTEVIPGNNSVLRNKIEDTREIRLNDRMNNIGFRFVSLNYINAADNNYQYMLEGYDSDWRNNGSSNTVFYQNLKPGNYLFKVRNAKEAENEIPIFTEVSITIHSTLFSTTFFYIFLFLLAVAAVFIMIRFRRKLPRRLRHMINSLNKFDKYKGSRIPRSQRESIIKELKQYMEEEKPYLNADLKLADLAEQINQPLNDISQVLNQDLDQSFSGFVNKYRVKEVKKLMSSKDYEKYTLVAIAQQCGFNSKTSFYRIFKKATGKTPADYLKELHN